MHHTANEAQEQQQLKHFKFVFKYDQYMKDMYRSGLHKVDHVK